MNPGHVIADKAYGSNAVLDAVEACGARPIIPPTRRSKRPRDFDPLIYKQRNLIERTINKLKPSAASPPARPQSQMLARHALPRRSRHLLGLNVDSP